MAHNLLSASEGLCPRDRRFTAVSVAFSVEAPRLLARIRGLVQSACLALSGNGVEEPPG
jgi:hypothetical protein